MKKLFITLSFIFILISGCEKEYDKVINPSLTEYRVEWAGVSGQDTIDIISGDSILYLQIKVYPPSAVNSVSAQLKNSFGEVISSLSLFDNGDPENSDIQAQDSIYSNHFILYKADPPGTYSISYAVNNKASAAQFFYFETEKYPPVISNLVFRDSVMFNEIFTFSVFAVDSNGAGDISSVYYELFKPDGSQVSNSQGITKFPMFDDGNPQAGDVSAGDSIYTQQLYFPANLPAFPTGKYRFQITAEDRTKRLSNIIIHFLEVY